MGAQIGDTTCKVDNDCAITSKHECCDCCPGEPRATSAAWLAWRDGTWCKSTRCDPCATAACPEVEPVNRFVTRCVADSCQLLRR